VSTAIWPLMASKERRACEEMGNLGSMYRKIRRACSIMFSILSRGCGVCFSMASREVTTVKVTKSCHDQHFGYGGAGDLRR
jgi:hypothetical protein